MSSNPNPTPADGPPNWHQLTQHEPRLDDLLNEARSFRDDGGQTGFCASDVWIRKLKRPLAELVGFGRRPAHRGLSTSDAYEIAMHKLLDALPRCRNCNCLSL